MYSGYGNSVSVYGADGFGGSFNAKDTEFGRGVINAFSSIGFFPPFWAKCYFSETGAALTVEMFDEFDNRKLSEPQREKLKAAFETLLGEDATVECFGDKLVASAPALTIDKVLK